ncbi:MAG TPA: sodium:proton antiporter [Chloroflexota bacterium]|nr:sodium:proton antiporter [Chloroflexota bacterium]
MSLFIAGTIGLLVAIGILHVLQRDVVRLVVGLYTFWNALNLLIVSVAAVRGTRAPIVDEGTGPMADPLVQAIVLTAIVITFGFTAFLITLLLWLVRHQGQVDVMAFEQGHDRGDSAGGRLRPESGEAQE